MAYDYRWGRHLPFGLANSTDPHYYSFEVGGVHWVILGSYTDFDEGSPQLQWLASDLAAVNRTRTPWLVAAVHSPWCVALALSACHCSCRF